MPGVKGRSGGKPKLTALKLLTGNPGHWPLNVNEPEPTPGKPVAPKFLDKVALEKWNDILFWCAWIAPVDGDMLALYCDAWARYLTARKLAGEPVIYQDGPRKNPAWTCLKEAFQQIRSAGSELGLSPSGRAGIPGGEKRDKIAEKYFS